jgi:hypothetical protein
MILAGALKTHMKNRQPAPQLRLGVRFFTCGYALTSDAGKRSAA